MLTDKEKSARTDTPLRLLNSFSSVYRGNDGLLEKVLAGFLSGGHVLLEGLPGTGKTIIGKTLSALIDGAVFKRIQFTPDLMPYDITGVEVWNEKIRGFVFHPGPVFAHIVLADEINRTTPKVQSALLEAMAESQVTTGNYTRKLPRVFFVIATQNPIENEGTYPLPEAQKDRFSLLLKTTVPPPDSEYSIVKDNPAETVLSEISPECTLEEAVSMKKEVSDVYMDEKLIRAIVNIAGAVRSFPDTVLGVSTRGILMLADTARALAYLRGRNYVIDKDISDLAVESFAHRIKLRGGSIAPEQLIMDITSSELDKIRHAG